MKKKTAQNPPPEPVSAPELVPEVVEIAPVAAGGGKQKIWMISTIILSVLLVLSCIISVIMINGANRNLASRNQQIAQMSASLKVADNQIAQISDSLKVADEQIAVLIEAAVPVMPLDIEHPAVQYLDSEETWVKADMDEIPELAGLWDAINTYDYDSLISYFPILNTSNNYMALLNRMRENLSDVQTSYGLGVIYSDDEQIVLHTYMFRLRPFFKNFAN
jgi:hypothetical protein